MLHATVTVDPAFVVGPVRPRTFGSFVEHLGRCVYTGIHDPAHPTADADGFRGDVVDLVRELGVTTVRYPGGNFVSAYRWEDGIGPVADRPRRLDLAWHSTEPNWVGLDEFLRWAEKTGVEPMMAVNLGTRGVQEALDLLEYCNVPGGTHFSDLRRANGREEPYRIKLWCLGNEMDGPWQTGHKTAHEYGRLAAETARAMRQVDPTIELVACGSSGRGMATFGAWENTVLTEAYDQVDLVSAHAYYWPVDGDTASFLASAVDMDRFIDDVVATADAVRAAGKHDKRIAVSFDEWNVWYMGTGGEDSEATAPKAVDDEWPVAPRLLEDVYDVADAVVVGNLLISLLRHTDRVHAASQAQLVNVIAPIMTEPGGRAWKQTIFHPFALTARHAAGSVLRVAVDAPATTTTKYGDVPLVDATVTHDAATGEVVVFAVNRSLDEPLALDVALRGFAGLRVVEAVTLSNPDHTWSATADDATSVLPRTNDSAAVADGRATATLPPVSWTMLRLGKA
ncbi:alpha-N-arabinofuranosidase [Xylanimonas protaetiae]|uniref:non-reducing end alpha-L-arabinofuranosidase n=1 Tax=Xylanimonas protaetiae TaxID=2509457 RepID=A0A4P6F309_9MICO|nr:alpha-N-arabinofuranosidase [Xylanimonas protaetiae]QAY69904.1 alpha-N-arabinofuranosidase [Xylanimonas protaetiae]